MDNFGSRQQKPSKLETEPFSQAVSQLGEGMRPGESSSDFVRRVDAERKTFGAVDQALSSAGAAPFDSEMVQQLQNAQQGIGYGR